MKQINVTSHVIGWRGPFASLESFESSLDILLGNTL